MVSRIKRDLHKVKSGKVPETDESLGLTPTQWKVFQYLKERLYAGASMPTLREICAEMGWRAVGTAQDVIKTLIEKGLLQKENLKARGLTLANATGFRSVPILGSAPAGNPIEAIEYHRGDAVVPSFVRGPVFAVRVQGDSMENAGIHDGDLAIVKQVATADHNDIVVAVLSGEVTIKRFMKKKDGLWLQPENPKYSPRHIEDESFRVLGKVIGLHRYWEDSY